MVWNYKQKSSVEIRWEMIPFFLLSPSLVSPVLLSCKALASCFKYLQNSNCSLYLGLRP
jgi:hypothetical protein